MVKSKALEKHIVQELTKAGIEPDKLIMDAARLVGVCALIDVLRTFSPSTEQVMSLHGELNEKTKLPSLRSEPASDCCCSQQGDQTERDYCSNGPKSSTGCCCQG